jgi:hypothetical protein
VNANSIVPAVVEGSGEGVVAHVGLHALGAFADRLGLGDSLSASLPVRGERPPFHDRGKVLTQAMLMLAGGGEACADIEHLRAQAGLFGSVPSDPNTNKWEWYVRRPAASRARPSCGAGPDAGTCCPTGGD